jgi:hypothetical protein
MEVSISRSEFFAVATSSLYRDSPMIKSLSGRLGMSGRSGQPKRQSLKAQAVFAGFKQSANRSWSSWLNLLEHPHVMDKCTVGFHRNWNFNFNLSTPHRKCKEKLSMRKTRSF